MDAADINTALKSRLAASGPAIGWAWPNVTAPAALPYGEIHILTPGASGGTLKGGEGVRRIEGSLMVVVATELGTGEDEALGYAQAIADLFEQGTRIAIDGGVVNVVEQPQVRGGFRDGAEWRVPVAVPFVAVAS